MPEKKDKTYPSQFDKVKEITDKLKMIDYEYDKDRNQFVWIRRQPDSEYRN